MVELTKAACADVLTAMGAVEARYYYLGELKFSTPMRQEGNALLAVEAMPEAFEADEVFLFDAAGNILFRLRERLCFCAADEPSFHLGGATVEPLRVTPSPVELGEYDDDERGEDYDPSPMCNCGTCTDGNYTCVERD